VQNLQHSGELPYGKTPLLLTLILKTQLHISMVVSFLHTHTHARTHAHTNPNYTHTHTHTHTHYTTLTHTLHSLTHTHTRTHTHTHTHTHKNTRTYAKLHTHKYTYACTQAHYVVTSVKSLCNPENEIGTCREELHGTVDISDTQYTMVNQIIGNIKLTSIF